jgi:hypothetical protein
MGMTDWLVTPDRVADFLVKQGLTQREARELASRPDVMRVAKDKYNGKPVPQGMKDLKSELPRIREQAAKAGVSFGQYVGSTVFGKPFAGEKAFFNTEGNAAAGKVAAGLPPGQKAAPPPANPIASAAQQPSPGGFALHAPQVSAQAVGGSAGNDWLAYTGPSAKRPYTLTAKDISPTALDIIAREAIPNDVRSIDAVIDSALNRIGGEGLSGKTGSVYDVLTAPGQYEAYDFLQSGEFKPASDAQRAQVLERLQAKASGREPDITGGANAYRAASYLEGRGKGKTFDRLADAGDFPNIGGNVYGLLPGTKLGPFASTANFALSDNPEMVTSLGGQEGVSSFRNSDIGSVAPTPGASLTPAAPPAPSPGMPSRNPMRGLPQIAANAQVGAMNGGLPPAPAYGAPGINPNFRASGSIGGMTPPPGVSGAVQFAPPMPTRNPMRQPFSATAQVGAMNGGLPPAPAYARAQFPDPVRGLGFTNATGLTSPLAGGLGMNPMAAATMSIPPLAAPRAYGATGMSRAMPSALGLAQIQPAPGVPPALARFAGRTPLPQINMSPVATNFYRPPAPTPIRPGIGTSMMTGGTNIPASPLGSGLGLSPLMAAAMSMPRSPVMPGSLMGGGINLPGSTSLGGGFGSPAMPRPAAMPSLAGGRSISPMARPMGPAAAAPPAPAGTNILGSTFGGAHPPGFGQTSAGVPTYKGRTNIPLLGAFAPGSWGNATNSMKLQDIGASYGRGAAALSAAINRGLQGFRANRAANAGARAASVRMLGNFPQTGQLLGVPQSASYGYL